MADLMLDALADARAALMTLGPPVHIAGDPDPPGEPELIVLQDVSDTALPTYGLRVSSKRLQVTCWAATKARSLELTELARTALATVGLRHLQSRPAADPDGAVGTLSDYRR